MSYYGKDYGNIFLYNTILIPIEMDAFVLGCLISCMRESECISCLFPASCTFILSVLPQHRVLGSFLNFTNCFSLADGRTRFHTPVGSLLYSCLNPMFQSGDAASKVTTLQVEGVQFALVPCLFT